MTKDIEREETKSLKKAIKELYEECDLLSEEEKDQFDDLFSRALKLGEMRERLKLEGCVVVPIKCPDPDFADLLFDELGKKAIGTFGEDMLIHFSDINEEKIWDLMLEAARGGNE